MKKKKKKGKRKEEKRFGITVGGLVPGINFAIEPNKRHYFFAAPNNIFYCGSYYTIVNRSTPFGEQLAVYTHSLERKRKGD